MIYPPDNPSLDFLDVMHSINCRWQVRSYIRKEAARKKLNGLIK